MSIQELASSVCAQKTAQFKDQTYDSYITGRTHKYLPSIVREVVEKGGKGVFLVEGQTDYYADTGDSEFTTWIYLVKGEECTGLGQVVHDDYRRCFVKEVDDDRIVIGQHRGEDKIYPL